MTWRDRERRALERLREEAAAARAPRGTRTLLVLGRRAAELNASPAKIAKARRLRREAYGREEES